MTQKNQIPQTSDSVSPSDKKFDFEKSLKELEVIVREFETNKDLPLDAALKSLERGLELIKICKGKLSHIENRIEELKLDFDSVFEER